MRPIRTILALSVVLAAACGTVPPRGAAAAATASAGEGDLHTGNAARLLVDGPAIFAAMFAAVDAARDSVLLESYIFDDSALAEKMAALLLKKQAQGVATYVLYDGVGSREAGDGYFDRLEKGGVAVCQFNPPNPLERPGYWGISHRDHRKILVVDGRQAYTGGVNVSGVYSSGSFSGRRRASSQQGWRDTQVELRGPAAAALAQVFGETWSAQGCKPPLPDNRAKPRAAPAGDKAVRIIASSPDQGSAIYATLMQAIEGARRSIHFTMAYFAPGEDFVAALCDAARRGVQVQLVLPSKSDFSLVLQAGRGWYQRLLDAGVAIHELQDAVLHAKTAVIDGRWSTVGSSNLDWRSFVANSEVNAVVLGEEFAREMEAMFQRDLAASTRITPEAWRARPLAQRMKEWFGRAFERLL